MLNLLKMETYRLKKTRSTWTILLALILFIVFINSAIYFLSQIDETANLNQQPEQTELDNVEVEIFVDESVDFPDDGNISADEYISTMLDQGALMLFVGIFVAFFITAEYKNGYIKNLASHLKSRNAYIFVKAIILSIFTLVFLVIYVLLTLGMGKILYQNTLELTFNAHFTKYLLTQLVMHFGFSMLVMLVAIQARSLSLPIIYTVIASTGFSANIYALLSSVLKKILPLADSFDLGNYLVDARIIQFSLDQTDIFNQGLIVGIIFFFVCLILSMLLFSKRDIA